MGEPLEEDYWRWRPRPAHLYASAVTTLIGHTVDCAAWMLPSRLRNWPPALLPTAETAELRQVRPSSTLACDIIKILKVLGWLALGALLTFLLVYKRATSLMKWEYDESAESSKPAATKPAEKTNSQGHSGKCVLPAYPENGSYVIHYAPAAMPGEKFEFAKLTVMCLPDFGVLGNEVIFCADGNWSAPIPKCVRFCKLNQHTSIHYHCLVNGSIQGRRDCNAYEPSGTVVKPECNRPNYYSTTTLPFMRCIDGSWNYEAVCCPECGRLTPNGVNLMIGGRPAKRGEVPWHVGVYQKTTKPYMQICGGSIVSNRLVISAAHCFWKDVGKQQPASLYAVAAGKIYRPWNNGRDKDAQKTDVKEIKIPARFKGSATNFQDDIALLILETPFVYKTFVRPVCLNFELQFDKRQLKPGNIGKVRQLILSFCKLNQHTSIHYHCLVNGSIQGRRDCNAYEPSGTVVKPECNRPNYYSTTTLPFMRCIDGSWNYEAVCCPECGRLTPNGVNLMIGGRPAKRGEVPWHVGVYQKTTKPYMQICGGSIVSNRLVISAAHCFWKDVGKQQPASLYAVAAGKIYRPWNNGRDKDAQKTDVKEIKIPARFQGSATNFQDDIALLILETPFVYKTFVRPVCLNFELQFDKRQLKPGNIGKVAGWGLTSENGRASPVLKVDDRPYVNIEECIAASPPSFRAYITSDKMCAGYGNGTALCKGDSGGGLAFPESERGTDRYYLRGVVSTAASNENLCNSHTLTTFTQILIHEHFVMEYLQVS